MEAETEFNVKWDDHRNVLIDTLKKFLTSGALEDCTLVAEGQLIKAHRIVLSAFSSYFKDLFSEYAENHPIIFLKDVKFQELKAIIDYIYHGEVKVTKKKLPSFLKTAKQLKLKGVSEILNKKGRSSVKGNSRDDLEASTFDENTQAESSFTIEYQRSSADTSLVDLHDKNEETSAISTSTPLTSSDKKKKRRKSEKSETPPVKMIREIEKLQCQQTASDSKWSNNSTLREQAAIERPLDWKNNDVPISKESYISPNTHYGELNDNVAPNTRTYMKDSGVYDTVDLTGNDDDEITVSPSQSSFQTGEIHDDELSEAETVIFNKSRNSASKETFSKTLEKELVTKPFHDSFEKSEDSKPTETQNEKVRTQSVSDKTHINKEKNEPYIEPLLEDNKNLCEIKKTTGQGNSNCLKCGKFKSLYNCPYCSHQFKHKANMDLHVSNVHKDLLK